MNVDYEVPYVKITVTFEHDFREDNICEKV